MVGGGGKRLGVGRVLGRAFPIWGRNLVSFSLLYAFVFAPLIAYGILAFPVMPGEAETMEPADFGQRVMWYSLVLTFGGCLLWFIAPLALIHGVLEQLRSRRASIGGCLRVYLTRLFPALGAGVAVGILTFLVAVLSVMVAAGLASVGFPRPLASILALLLPTLVACVFWVVVPVAAAERRGLFGSLGRAAELTRGSRLRVFVVVLVSVVIQLAPLLLARAAAPQGSPIAGWTVVFFTVTLGSYGAVATGVAYHDLREAKDGILGVEQLAKVFA